MLDVAVTLKITDIAQSNGDDFKQFLSFLLVLPPSLNSNLRFFLQNLSYVLSSADVVKNPVLYLKECSPPPPASEYGWMSSVVGGLAGMRSQVGATQVNNMHSACYQVGYSPSMVQAECMLPG